MLRFGVIGYGYWGPNIVRNLYSLGSATVVSICDKSISSLERAKKAYPGVHVTADYTEMMAAPDIDAVAVITPVWTHFELAKSALMNGKHVFIEKPFTSNSQQAEELIELAERKGLTIMVDHTFLFTGAVRKIDELLKGNALGKLKYYDSTRVNLGLFQHDIDVLWDLAPHDLSVVDYLIGEKPEAIVATGAPHTNGLSYVAFMTVYFPNNVIAHINVNWLSPVKIRTTLIGGENKMLVWNDLEADEKIKIYDKGVDISSREGVYNLLVSYRSGDMWSPKLQATEALKEELSYFVECVENRKRPFNDGIAGLRVVRMLEAACESLKKKGETGLRVNGKQNIAPDVKLGRDVKIYDFVNLYGCKIGDNSKIGTFVEVQKNASIGKNCKISSHTFICEGVTIEDNVFIGHGVMFINDIYPRATTVDGGLQREQDWKVEPTLVKKGASIGSGATILAKVVIGENAIVGAGSVVTKDVPPNTIAAGNPARVLRAITSSQAGGEA